MSPFTFWISFTLLSTARSQQVQFLPEIAKTPEGCILVTGPNCFKALGTYLSTGLHSFNCSNTNTCRDSASSYGVNFASLATWTSLQIPEKTLQVRFLSSSLGERRYQSWRFSDEDEYTIAMDWLDPLPPSSLDAIVVDRLYPLAQPLISQGNAPHGIPLTGLGSLPNVQVEALYSLPGYTFSVVLADGTEFAVTKSGPSVQDMLSAHQRYFGINGNDNGENAGPNVFRVTSIKSPLTPSGNLPPCQLKIAIHIEPDLASYPNWLDLEHLGIVPPEFTCVQKGEEATFLTLARSWRKQLSNTNFTLEAGYVDSGTAVFFDFLEARSIEVKGDRESKMGVAFEKLWPTKIIIR